MEIPDDSNDKIRRNLVTASTGVIVAACLDVPLAELLLKVSVMVEPWRLIAVALGVLLYLLIRDRFSEDGEHFNDVVAGEAHQHAWLVIDARFREEIELINTGATSVRDRQLVEIVEEHLAKLNDGPFSFPKHSVHLGSVKARHFWNVEYRLDLLIKSKASSKPWENGDGVHHIDIVHAPTRPILRWAKFKGWSQTLIYSKISVTSVAPIYLAATAIAILVCRAISL